MLPTKLQAASAAHTGDRIAVQEYLPLHSVPKTRIMVTVGRRNFGTDQLRAMVTEGASIVRFNGSGIKEGKFEFNNDVAQ